MANSAGRPAPASTPNTTIFQMAEKLIQPILCFLSPSGRGRGLGFGRSDAPGPFVVHIVVIHLGGPGPQVDGSGEAGEDAQEDDHAQAAADAVSEPVRQGAGDPGG